jgi:hypothetical protein
MAEKKPWEMFAAPEEQGPWTKFATAKEEPKPEPTFMQRAGTALGRGLEAVPESAAGIGFGVKAAMGMTPEASAAAEQIRKEGAADKRAPGISFEELEKTYSDKGLIEALKKAGLAGQVLIETVKP